MDNANTVETTEATTRKGKIPYKIKFGDWGDEYYKPVELTGKVKLMFGGPERGPGEYTKYYQARWFFGLFTYWLSESRIEWHEPVTERTYDERI